MSATGKLAGFAAVLLLVFGGAVAAGAIGPERDGSDRRRGGHHGRSRRRRETAPDRFAAWRSPTAGSSSPWRGRSWRGRPAELRFSILGSDGQPVRDFEVEHEKRMHVIVVRRDGQGFQHLHPELGATASGRRLTLPEAGAYRVFADFKHDGEARTLGADLAVDGKAGYRPLHAPATSADTGDGYRVRLDAGACAPAARPSCASRSAATASRSGRSGTSAPADTWWRCARATSRICTCIPKSTATRCDS